LFKTGRVSSTAEAKNLLQESLGKTVHPSTIQRALIAAGFKFKVSPKKPLLTSKHRQDRLRFARKYKTWTTADWRRVIFSDEVKIERFRPARRHKSWVFGNQPTPPRLTLKYGGGSFMVWACITDKGPGYACKLLTNMNADVYLTILKKYLVDTLKFYGLSSPQIIYQHDNDPKHTAEKVQEWLADRQFQVLDWPSQSPDLNPIENLWSLVKDRVGSRVAPSATIDEVWAEFEEQWNAVSREECLKLIDSMPDRIRAVLKSKGGHTRW
jgi:transposase